MSRIAVAWAVALLFAAGCGVDSDTGATATENDVITTTVPPGTTADDTTTTGPTTTSMTDRPTTAPDGDGTEPGCSASELAGEADPQQGLLDEVQRTRRAIIASAVACDYEALAELAQNGDRPFTYSFGNGGDPAEHWRRLEADGQDPEPLRYLVELLRRPHGQRTVEGVTTYEWPSAFTHDDWADVPEADREALRPLYDEEDFAFFELFGGYIGYRVGIAADGEWLFFVAGD